MNKPSFFQYGEKVPDYDVLVLNEREARAAAGILFVGAFLSLMNGVMLGTAVMSKYFITFFTIDFILRVVQPRYAPSLLLGRMFVQNQRPEYVGATQKRFAWGIGLMLALPMFYFLVIDFQPNPIKVFVCIICLALLLFESAFSICLGCKIYGLFKKDPVTHCPGGVCEIRAKDPIQRFSPIQKGIVLLTIMIAFYGTYAYFTKLPTRTPFIKKMTHMMMSQEALDELDYQKGLDEFNSDDDDF